MEFSILTLKCFGLLRLILHLGRCNFPTGSSILFEAVALVLDLALPPAVQRRDARLRAQGALALVAPVPAVAAANRLDVAAAALVLAIRVVRVRLLRVQIG